MRKKTILELDRISQEEFKKKNKIPAFRTGNGLLMKERPTLP